jgi:hypothetical protein
MDKIEGRFVDGIKVYTTAQVIELFDLKPARFRQWLRLGYIKPDTRAPAAGSYHYFEKENLYIIALFINLINLGLNRYIASEWAYSFDYQTWADNISHEDEFYLIARGDTSQREQKSWKKNINCGVKVGPLPDDLKKDRAAVIMNLKEIWREIDALVD